MTLPFFNYVDRTIFVATAGGTNPFVVATPVQGYQLPITAGAVDQAFYAYAAQSSDLSQWEYGYGQYTAATHTLTRVPLGGVNGAALVNFTAPPTVFLGQLAESIYPRQLLRGNIAFYVTATGSASNDGSITQPWATIQHALNVIAQTLDFASFTVTVNVGPGVFVGYGHPAYVGGGILLIKGSGVAATFVTPGPNDGVLNFGGCGEAFLPTATALYQNQLTFDNTNALTSAAVSSGINISFTIGTPDQAGTNAVNFIVADSTYAVDVSGGGSAIFFLGGFSNTADFGFSLAAGGSGTPFGIAFGELGGSTFVQSGQWHVNGNPSWIVGAVRLNTGAQYVGNFGGNLGTASGFRYIVDAGSNMQDNFAGGHWFPGNKEGITDGSSVYGQNLAKFPNTHIDTDYTLTQFDGYYTHEMQSAAPHTLTVPTQASVTFGLAVGIRINVMQTGTGAATIAAAVGVTGHNFGVIGGQWNAVTLYQRAIDEWVMVAGLG